MRPTTPESFKFVAPAVQILEKSPGKSALFWTKNDVDFQLPITLWPRTLQTWNFNDRYFVLMCFYHWNLVEKYWLCHELFEGKISIFSTLTASRRPTGGPLTSKFCMADFLNRTNNPWKFQVDSIIGSDFSRKAPGIDPFWDQKWPFDVILTSVTYLMTLVGVFLLPQVKCYPLTQKSRAFDKHSFPCGSK